MATVGRQPDVAPLREARTYVHKCKALCHQVDKRQVPVRVATVTVDMLVEGLLEIGRLAPDIGELVRRLLWRQGRPVQQPLHRLSHVDPVEPREAADAAVEGAEVATDAAATEAAATDAAAAPAADAAAPADAAAAAGAPADAAKEAAK